MSIKENLCFFSGCDIQDYFFMENSMEKYCKIYATEPILYLDFDIVQLRNIGLIESIFLINVYSVRRKIYDEYNDEEVELTKHETKLISRLLKGKAPHANFDPHAVRNFLFILWSPFWFS